MSGIAQTNPWSYNPYSTLGTLGIGSIGPSILSSQAPGLQSLQYLPHQIQQVQQLLQIVPQQLHQLQQVIQFLPQQIAQLVVQTLIQSQGIGSQGVPFGVSPFGPQASPFSSPNVGLPFQSMPSGAGSPFVGGQPGHVM